MPSNKLPRVGCSPKWLAIRPNTHFQKGKAIELPKASYLAVFVVRLRRPSESVHSPISVQPSGKPCNLSHSTGVNLRTPSFSIMKTSLPPPYEPDLRLSVTLVSSSYH